MKSGKSASGRIYFLLSGDLLNVFLPVKPVLVNVCRNSSFTDFKAIVIFHFSDIVSVNVISVADNGKYDVVSRFVR